VCELSTRRYCAQNRSLRNTYDRVFIATVSMILISLALTGCFASIKGAQSQALKLETDFHASMTRGDLAGIYAGADQRYRDAVTREKSDALFSSIARKLGAPLDCRQGKTTVQVATWGTTIRSVCQTSFSKNASGVESFVWVKSGDQFRLLSYYVNSDELIER
jgi:hypothetical protein